jgi:hypothetical protein
LKKAVLVAIFLLFVNLYPAFGDYGAPTSQEQDLYNRLLTEFEKLTIPKKDVSDTLESFEEPITISFPCHSTDTNSFVNVMINTKLVNFDDSLASHEGTITGGIYVWKCSITYSEGKVTINCNNGLMLNSNAILQTSERDSQVKLIEDLVIFYHELLHGQLMIDAIKSSDTWHDDICNKKYQEEIDYSYTDANHKIITSLQTDFASQLVKNIGGIFQVEEIIPQETTDGAFTKKVGSLYDYPQYAKNGISVSARSYNVADIQITSKKNDIIISGHINTKSQSGIIWLYIFGRSQETSGNVPTIETKNEPQQTIGQSEIPNWVKNNAGWWADGTIGDNDFVLGIKYLIDAAIIKIPTTVQDSQASQQIPSWVKNNAKWWTTGAISDSDFVHAIQYLIRSGIMQIQTVNLKTTNPIEPNSSSQKLSFVSVNSNAFEKHSHQSTQVQITGKIENFKTGTYVILTITKPDQSSYDLRGILSSKGLFAIPMIIDGNSQTGDYIITAKYNNVEFGTAFFTVK